MNTRYRITRSHLEDQSENPISLEECKTYFEKQPDFVYAEQYTVRSGQTMMTIKGAFFMWQAGGTQIPFRYYEGDVYVAVSDERAYTRMLEVAEGLQALYMEG